MSPTVARSPRWLTGNCLLIMVREYEAKGWEFVAAKDIKMGELILTAVVSDKLQGRTKSTFIMNDNAIQLYSILTSLRT